MRPKVKRIIKDAQVLSGSEARFVSLVDSGANETPFVLIKSKKKHGDNTMSIKKRAAATTGKVASRSAKSHKPLVTNAAKKKAAAVAEDEKLVKTIARFEYSKDHFEDEDEVREHVEKSDWDGAFTISETDELYIVTPDGLDPTTLLKVSGIALPDKEDEGVTAFVGLRKATDEDDDDIEEDGEDEDGEDADDDAEGDDDDEEEDEPAPAVKTSKAPAKTVAKKTGKPEVVNKRAAFLAKRGETRKTETKFSYWSAYDSLGEDFKDVLKAGMSDGVPPGVDELLYVMSESLRKTLADPDLSQSEKTAKLTASASDFATTVGKLDAMFDELVGAEDLAKMVKADELPVVERFMQGYADFLEAEAAPVVSKKSVKKSTKVDNTPVIDYKKDIADAVSEALAPISETVSKLASRSQVSKTVKAEETGNQEADPKVERKKQADSDAKWLANKAKDSIF